MRTRLVVALLLLTVAGCGRATDTVTTPESTSPPGTTLSGYCIKGATPECGTGYIVGHSGGTYLVKHCDAPDNCPAEVIPDPKG